MPTDENQRQLQEVSLTFNEQIRSKLASVLSSTSKLTLTVQMTLLYSTQYNRIKSMVMKCDEIKWDGVQTYGLGKI